MDLSQKKLSRVEWNSVEIPVSESEQRILQMILDGYANPDICVNTNQSLFDIMKVSPTPELEYYLFHTHFEPAIQNMLSVGSGGLSDSKSDSKSKKGNALTNKRRIRPQYAEPVRNWLNAQKTNGGTAKKQPNKADMIRIQKTEQTIAQHRHAVFEFVLLDYCGAAICENYEPNNAQWSKQSEYYIYSLLQFQKAHIRNVNQYILAFVAKVIEAANPADKPVIQTIFEHAPEYIERNTALLKYQDQTLYTHQRDLFRAFRPEHKNTPKCVLYMAPTGTGKTMSPIGLSCGFRVIFVCAARHVGLALAKSAISVGKRVAFAFHCDTASDVRLHYFAAADYTVNKRTGGIGKIDNTNGRKVEIMICDIYSYTVAMHYMKAFNSPADIITYWDEPTISMDYETHELHPYVQKMWAENQIPNLVLSSATLPDMQEIQPMIRAFVERINELYIQDTEDGAHPVKVQNIKSYDCKKTISILDKDGQIVLPHLLFAKYRDIVDCVEHCEKNKYLLRYFDVAEIVRFLKYVNSRGLIENYLGDFTTAANIDLLSIKTYYLKVLGDIDADEWPTIYSYMTQSITAKYGEPITKQSSMSSATGNAASSSLGGQQLSRMNSVGPTTVGKPSVNSAQQPGKPTHILLTTNDAHTLTDGPTIFLTEDPEKIGKFYIQQSKIPETVFQIIQQKIDRNNDIQKHLRILERELEDKRGSSGGGGGGDGDKDKDNRKAEREPQSKEIQRMMDAIQQMRDAIQAVRLSSMYVPNTKSHQDIWLPANKPHIPNAFIPNVDDDAVREIMSLNVDNQKKILLILGIGVFSATEADNQYMEVMKNLAYNQQLFLIIAGSDYIYGTNYQFCHGFIGKDLDNMTQQKTIQAIGRIGRNNIQQEYTVRFRDNDVIMKLFKRVDRNLEADVMNRLFGETV